MHSLRSRFQNSNVESVDELENLYPNLSLTVENKIGNSHKRGWSHFKLNINDWDSPFPKVLRIIQWIGKNIFHWGKWNEPIKLIRKLEVLDWRLK